MTDLAVCCTPSFMTRELKEIARQEAPMLVKQLLRLATKAESEAARVAATSTVVTAAPCSRSRAQWNTVALSSWPSSSG